MTENYMRQCKMVKYLPGGSRIEIVSWIPEKYAVPGKCLDLKDDGKWSKGFEVISVSLERRSAKETNKRSQDYKKQRKASDI